LRGGFAFFGLKVTAPEWGLPDEFIQTAAPQANARGHLNPRSGTTQMSRINTDQQILDFWIADLDF